FGLFAGCSVGALGEETELATEEVSAYRRHTRLDMDYLSRLAEALQRDPRLARELLFRANSHLYEAAGRLRYAESRREHNVPTNGQGAVDRTDYLISTRSPAEKGGRVEELAEALTGEEVTKAEAEAYIQELIDNQVLVSDLDLNVTGAEPLPELIHRLQQ